MFFPFVTLPQAPKACRPEGHITVSQTELQRILGTAVVIFFFVVVIVVVVVVVAAAAAAAIADRGRGLAGPTAVLFSRAHHCSLRTF